MASIEVDGAGLSSLAGYCENQAAILGAITTPSISGDEFQPSAVAVGHANAAVAAAAARVTARMRETAIAASFAAIGYVSTETWATTTIGAIGGIRQV